MMKRLLLLWMMIIPCYVQAADRALVDQLYDRSGMQRQNAEIPMAVVDGFASELQGQSVEAFELLKSSALEAFKPEMFEAVIKQRFMNTLSDGQVSAVIAWLDTPVGRNITQIEQESSTPEAQRGFEAYVNALRQQPLPQSRLSLMKHFDQAVSGSRFAGEVAFTIQMAVLSGLIAIAPEVRQNQLAAIKGQLIAGKAQMMAEVGQQSFVFMLYTYRNVSDADLKQYLAFANSPAGKAYHHESLQASLAAFEACSKKMGVLIGLKQRGDSMDI